MDTLVRLCPKCGLAKTNRGDGWRCVPCRREVNRRCAAKNSAKNVARATAWDQVHPEARRARRAKWDQVHPEKARAKSQVRRALKSSLTVEVFTDIEIFERDGWICQLCMTPVDRALQWPDPMSVSLDHIIPIAKHGAHTRANTQCAHLVCNTRKGAN